MLQLDKNLLNNKDTFVFHFNMEFYGRVKFFSEYRNDISKLRF